MRNIFIKFANTEFLCPNCARYYNDENDKYLKKLNRNKYCRTSIKCECGTKFYITPTYCGDLASFEMPEKIKD